MGALIRMPLRVLLPCLAVSFVAFGAVAAGLAGEPSHGMPHGGLRAGTDGKGLEVPPLGLRRTRIPRDSPRRRPQPGQPGR
jgi:hypothetical protein